MTTLETIDKLHPDLVAQYMSTGRADGIPKDVQLFLKQLQWSAEIYEFERNITRAASNLRQRIRAEQLLDIDVRTCKSRIYAAINYFNIDNNVAIKVWESNYADKYEDLAKLACISKDYKTQMKCYNEAMECRRRAAAIAEADRDMGIIFLIDPRVTPEDMGYESQSIKKIATKNNDGFYLDIIRDLPLESMEKKRLLRDADIQEAEYIESNQE